MSVVVSRCVDLLDSRHLSSVQVTEQLHRVERCIRVLERVSHTRVLSLLTVHHRHRL